MALSPDEVESKEFVRVLRGYDPAEVASFLRVVGAEMRRRDQVVEAIERSASGPLAHEVVAVLRTAYEAAQARTRPAPRARRKTSRPAAPAVTSSPAKATKGEGRRARPLRVGAAPS
jgi:DivIVA domain-containing protein